MATTEHTINDAIAELLRSTRAAWRSSDIVRSENTGLIKGGAKRPDILVLEPNVSPVVIETEVLPAISVEADAISRLGAQLRTTGRTILSSIGVRLPDRLRSKSGGALRKELSSSLDLEACLFTGREPGLATRWPKSGWIRSSIADLSILAQSASIPPDVIDAAAAELVSGVSEAAAMLGEIGAAHEGAVAGIAKELCQQDSEQTRAMATTILTNAFVFHETLAGGNGPLASIKSLDQLRGGGGALSKTKILAEWRRILKINYWPIFDIARRILELIPAANAKGLIDRIVATAQTLLEHQLMRSHDLTGAVFQRLIVDRKFLAAYYTAPASASLLVGLALSERETPAGGSWSKLQDVQNLKLADFACGTGTLLSTTYQRIGQLHELAGGDSEALHPPMMAHSLIGCDVLPAAAHLTASMLSGAHPTTRYTQSSIMTVAYGKQSDGSIALGSLDLLNPQGNLQILAVTAKAIEAMGEAEKETWASLPHASFDVVTMNPPFTRATVHEADRLNVPNPMFAAFTSSAEEQRLMGAATKRLTAGTAAHGNAGEASIFLVLADRKLKPGGVLALVMPLSLMAGESWEDARALLANAYSDLIVVSIAAAKAQDMSFSADTDMGECLVIGKKTPNDSSRATFVVLNERPAYPLLGASAAVQIRRLVEQKNLRRLEDGPAGGTQLTFGNDVIGQAMDAPAPATGGWNLARIADLSLAQTAYQMIHKQRLWLPTMTEAAALPISITSLRAIAKVGPIHRDINGKNPDGGARGPFDVTPLKKGSVPTYPALWAHDAHRERAMAFDADSEALPRKGETPEETASLAQKAAAVWGTASYCHFNCDFQFNSQSTGMQFTPRKTIGGRAWLSIQLPTVEQEKALVLWANTTLGLLLRWWHSNKQQSGRGNMGKSTLQTLPILDITKLTASQLSAAVAIFDALSAKSLLPIDELHTDAVRADMDSHFARDVLGLEPAVYSHGGALDLLRMKLAAEPSVRG